MFLIFPEQNENEVEGRRQEKAHEYSLWFSWVTVDLFFFLSGYFSRLSHRAISFSVLYGDSPAKLE